jgi:hypothetical protein
MQAYKTYFFHHFIVPWIFHSMSAVVRSANEKNIEKTSEQIKCKRFVSWNENVARKTKKT